MTTDLRGDAIKPQNIHADRPRHELRIEWADGHASVFELTALRWLCPCAYCRGEAGQPGWLDSNPTLTEDQVELSDISLVGNYALQPTWADGHSSGFYSFEHLRRNCRCAEDSADRPPTAGRPASAARPEGAPPHTHD
jgi:DUF971 family protein